MKKATETADRLNLSRVGGTDAHYGPQIGYGYTVIEAEEASVESIAKAIVEGYCRPFGQSVPLTLNLLQEFERVKRKLTKGNST